MRLVAYVIDLIVIGAFVGTMIWAIMSAAAAALCVVPA